MLDLSKYQQGWVKIADINAANREFQFRRDITPESVAGLAKSMAENGQKFAILLWRRHSGELVVVSGLRRLAAAISLKWESILAITIPEADASQEDMLSTNFIENIDRKTLNTLDIMFACKRLKDEKKKTNEEIGLLIGKTEGQVRRYIKVAEAPEDVHKRIITGEISATDVGNAGNRNNYDSVSQNKNMYVKSTKSGFCATLKFDRKRDNPDQAIAFAQDLIKQIKEQAQLQRKEQRGKSKGKGEQPMPLQIAPDQNPPLDHTMPKLEVVEAGTPPDNKAQAGAEVDPIKALMKTQLVSTIEQSQARMKEPSVSEAEKASLIAIIQHSQKELDELDGGKQG
jgi:ParB/RepB/Spo0J family partition protein